MRNKYVTYCSHFRQSSYLCQEMHLLQVVQRDIHLLDQSEVTIACTLWHSEAEAFDGTDSPVVAIKSCKVSNFGGRSLSCLASTQVSVKPNIPRAGELQSWFSRRRTQGMPSKLIH